MHETVSSMNGTLWIFAGFLIAMVVVQAVIFIRLALNFNKKNNLVTSEEIKSAARTGTVSVVGPAISAMVVALSLIATVGPAVTFMRCGVIGAPSWELLMANTAAATVGAEFNSASFTPSVFTLCIFGMTFASAPYFINTIITLKPLDMAVAKSQSNADKKESFIPTLGAAAMMGIMGYSIVDHLKTIPGIAAVLSSAAISLIIMNIIKKTGKKWLADWNMAVSMICGMAVAQIVATLMA